MRLVPRHILQVAHLTSLPLKAQFAPPMYLKAEKKGSPYEAARNARTPKPRTPGFRFTPSRLRLTIPDTTKTQQPEKVRTAYPTWLKWHTKAQPNCAAFMPLGKSALQRTIFTRRTRSSRERRLPLIGASYGSPPRRQKNAGVGGLRRAQTKVAYQTQPNCAAFMPFG
jgi:hypothetical protein